MRKRKKKLHSNLNPLARYNGSHQPSGNWENQIQFSLLVSHCQPTEIGPSCSSLERAVVVPAAQLALERAARRCAAEEGGELCGIRWLC